jgi:predicted O-methyltransferase YrrM
MININDLIEEFENNHESKGMVEDCKILYRYAIENQYKNILELGILHANSTKVFALAAFQIPNCRFTSLDIEQYCIDEAKQRLQVYGLESFANFVNLDSVKFLETQPDGSYDCIFIDTNHELKQSLAELFLSALKSNKHIFLHDTSMPGVMKSIETLRKFEPQYEIMNFPTPSGLGLVIKK